MRKNNYLLLFVIVLVICSQIVFCPEEMELVVTESGSQDLSRSETKRVFKDVGVMMTGYSEGITTSGDGIINHQNGDSINTNTGEFPSGSEVDCSNGITVIIENDFDRSNLPEGNYNVRVKGRVSIGGDNYIEPTSDGDVELTYENGELMLDEFSEVTYNGVELKTYGTTLTLGEQSQGNYFLIQLDGDIEFRGSNFRVVDGNYMYVPINEGANEDPTIVSEYSFSDTQLQRGSKGDDVKHLQAFLRSHMDYDITVDGIFGEETETALINFQRTTLMSGVPDRGMEYLNGDGVLGQDTIQKINDLCITQVNAENCVIAYYDDSFNDGPYSIARVEDGEITTSKKNRMYDIVIESDEQVMYSYYSNEEGTHAVIFDSDGTTGSQATVQVADTAEETVKPETVEASEMQGSEQSDYDILQSYLGLPYGPKYPQGPDSDQKHLDCISILYEFAEDKGIQLSGSRGDQIYARHTTPITTITNENADLDRIQTGDIVFIGHQFNGVAADGNPNEGGISAYHNGIVGAPVKDSSGTIIDYTMIHASGRYGRNQATQYYGSVKEVSMLSYLNQYKNNNRRNNMFIGRLNSD